MQQVFELAVLKCHERFSVDMALTPDLSSFKFVYDERDVDLTGNVESSRFFHMIGNIDLVKTIDGAALEAAPAPTIVPAAASLTARPFITTPWKIGSEVECEFSEGNLRTAFIRSITTSFANGVVPADRPERIMTQEPLEVEMVTLYGAHEFWRWSFTY